MKAILKASRGKLLGRRVDSLIHMLTGDVVNRYDFMTFMKEHGFVSNKRERALALTAIVRARAILDECVELPVLDGEAAYVTSSKRPSLRYTVLNPGSKWAVCECLHSQKGNICKHQVKVLQMLRPDLADGRIARVLGSLKGTLHGGVSILLKPSSPMYASADVEMPPPSPPRPVLGEVYEDVDDLMCQLIIKIAERASRIPVVMRHFISDLKAMDIRHAALEVQFERGLLHPSQHEAMSFIPVQDGRNNSFIRLRDFIDGKGYRTRG